MPGSADARGGGSDPAQEGGHGLPGPHLCEDSQNHSRATRQETGVQGGRKGELRK